MMIFLSAPNPEEKWLILGSEFGMEQGKVFILVRALYGFKLASVVAFLQFVAKKLDEIGFKSCVEDPDSWLSPATKPDGTQYYSYGMMYMNDILSISTNATKILKSLEVDTINLKMVRSCHQICTWEPIFKINLSTTLIVGLLQ